MVIDSGATAHMSSNQDMFSEITYFSDPDQHRVIMGDDKTTIPIAGHGYMYIVLHGKHLRVHGYYVPGMGPTALFSVKQHMANQGCYFHAAAGNCELAFPTFTCSPRIAQEIEVIVHTPQNKKSYFDFDEHSMVKLHINTVSIE
jgi:hypothetical protein